MSFFAFQDIIACTTGIMVLLTLMLVMELLTRTLGATDAAEAVEAPVDLTKAVAKAVTEQEQLQRKFEANAELLERLSSGPVVTEGQITELERKVRDHEEAIKLVRSRMDEAKGELEEIGGVLARTEQEVEELESKTAAWAEELARRRRETPVTVVDKSGDDAKPLFVECGAGLYVVARIPQEGPDTWVPREVVRFEGADAKDRFLVWARRRDPGAEKFVLLMRPEAAGDWDEVRESLKGKGFSVGWDAWPVEKQLMGGNK